MLSDSAQEFQQTYYVSCWHMNPDENIAMWERYVRSNDAVAISSKYSTLRSQLDSHVIEMGLVRYINYEISGVPSPNRLQLIMHKRHFFADEKEVRAVMWSLMPWRDHIEPYFNTDRTGFLAPISPNALIGSVVLHPEASADTIARVSELCEMHNLPRPFLSRIASRPRF